MAVTLTLADLRPAADSSAVAVVETDIPDAALQRALDVAAALVARHAPDAPDAVQNEAVVMVIGHLVEHPKSGLRQETVGEYSASYSTLARSAMIHSGATSILGPWRVHRAGIIE